MTIQMIHHTIKHADVFPEEACVEPELKEYNTRYTAKGIILDQHKKIALVAKKGSGFYFLPGGGIEAGESAEQALKRESMEEIGGHIIIDRKFAVISEPRAKSAEIYETSCFIARLSGDAGEPDLTPEDSLLGMETLWIGRPEAMELLKKQAKKINYKTDNYYNRRFNTVRDLYLIEKSLV